MKALWKPCRSSLLVFLVLFSSINLFPVYRANASDRGVLNCVEDAGLHVMDMIVHLLDPEEEDTMKKLWWLGDELVTWGTECAISETKLSSIRDVVSNMREINRIYEKYGGSAPPLDVENMWDWAKLFNAGVQLGFSLNTVGKGAAALNAAIVATPALGVVMVPFASAALVAFTVLPIVGDAFSWIDGNLFIVNFTHKHHYTRAQKAVVQAWADDRRDIVIPGDQVNDPSEYLHLWQVGFQDGDRLYNLVPDCRVRLLSDGTYALDLYLFFYTMCHPPYLWSVGNDLEVAVEMEFEGGETVPLTDGFIRPYEGTGFQAEEIYGFTETADPVPLATLNFPSFTTFPKDIVYRFRHPSLATEPIKVIRLHPFHPMVVEGTEGTNDVLISGCAGENIPFSFDLSTHPGWIWSEIETHETAGTANDPGSTTFWTSDVLQELGDAVDTAEINAELDARVPETTINLPNQISVDSQGTTVSGFVRVPTDTETGTYGFWVLCTSARGGTTPVHILMDVSSCDAVAPGSLTAIGTGEDIELTWEDNSDDESGFEIWRRKEGLSYGTTYYERTQANAESFTDTAVTEGTTYIYKVRAFVAGAPESYSEFSNEAAAGPARTAPSPPTALSVREANDAVVLNWTDTSDNETGFEIWKRTGDADYGDSYYARVDSNVEEWTDSAVSVGTTYTYKVRSCNDVGPSEFCPERGCTFWGAGVASPSQLTANALSAQSVYLTWQDNSGNEKNYVIKRKEEGDRYFGIVEDDLPPDSSSFNDIYALEPETTYVYRVCAANPSGSSCSSEVLCTTNSEFSGMAATPWPTGQGGEQRTGCSVGFGTLVPEVDWERARLGNGWAPMYASPVIGSDGTVYIARGEQMFALDQEDGSDRAGWPFTALNDIRCTPSIDSNGRIYFGDKDGWLYAVSPNGHMDWKTHLTPGRELSTSPAFIRHMGDVYILVTNGPHRFKLKPDGSTYNYRNDSFTYGSPAIDSSSERFACGAGSNTIAICDFDLNCFEYDTTGSFRGSFDFSTPIGDNGLVYATNTQGYLLVFDPETMEERWHAKITEGEIGFEEQPPAIGPNGTVYCMDQSATLHAWQDQGSTGVKKWDLSLGNGSYQMPVVDQRGIIYVATRYGTLHAVRDEGDRAVLLWTYTPSGEYKTPRQTSPAIDAGGRVYFSTPWSFTALYGEDLLAPQAVTDCQVATDSAGASASLMWTNPVDPQLDEVVVRQKRGAWPSDHSDGGLAFQDLKPKSGEVSSVTVGGLGWGSSYHWAVFSRDLSGNWIDTVNPGENAVSAVLGPPDTPAILRIDTEGNVFTDGSFEARSFESGSADIAEWVSVTDSVESGDVLAFDINSPESYCLTSTPCSSLVAGVVSSNPGVMLGQTSIYESSKALMALVGIVPVKVTNEGGPIQPGDLLISSSTPGYAMRWGGEGPCPCALVGKALEPFDGEKGLIQVLLTAH